jgi:regulatory protein
MTATESERLAGRRIGSVLPDPRRAGSVRIVVDGRPLLTVPREFAERERLVAGTPLDEPLYARLCHAADEEAAFRTALRILGRRPFASRDLARRLVLKGHPPDAADAARERASALGLLDDAAYSRNYVETRGARGRGALRLRRDLAAQGVERGVIDTAIGEVFGADGTSGPQVEALARKRLGQLRGLPRPVQRRRVLAFLARRGFVGAPVTRIVGQLLESA